MSLINDPILRFNSWRENILIPVVNDDGDGKSHEHVEKLKIEPIGHS